MNEMAENQTHIVLESLYGELEAAEEVRDHHWVIYESAAKDCDAIERIIGVIERRQQGTGQTENPPVVQAEGPASGTAAVSLDGCKNIEQRLIRMAESWGGTVDCHDAARLLINMGISTSSEKNLVSALQKEMTKKEGRLWEYTGPRTYRYLPHGKAGDEGTSNNATMNNFE